MEALRGADGQHIAQTLKRSFTTPRREPSPYPFPLTYIISFFAFASSAIVLGIVAYFVWHLNAENMSAPASFHFVSNPSSPLQ
jgi:hypothetical protein